MYIIYSIQEMLYFSNNNNSFNAIYVKHIHASINYLNKKKIEISRI